MALRGPNSESRVHCLRLAERQIRTLCSLAITATIRHSWAGSYQKTLGSRNSREPMSMTGLPEYLVHV